MLVNGDVVVLWAPPSKVISGRAPGSTPHLATPIGGPHGSFCYDAKLYFRADRRTIRLVRRAIGPALGAPVGGARGCGDYRGPW